LNEPKLKVKAVLFDLDGTIVDSKRAYSTALRTALSKVKKQNPFELRLATEIPKRLEQNLPISNIIQGINISIFLQDYLNAYYQATATHARPFPNISHVLAQLSHRFKVGLVTMRCVPKERIIEELTRFNLADYFQCITTAVDTHDPKPSPEALIKCARELKVKLNECVTVGDSVVDIRAGKIAGTKTVAVLSGIFSRQELQEENPDLIVESVRDLPGYLE
jgi:HAD superfamily hydrolase (TIGR01549 family)